MGFNFNNSTWQKTRVYIDDDIFLFYCIRSCHTEILLSAKSTKTKKKTFFLTTTKNSFLFFIIQTCPAFASTQNDDLSSQLLLSSFPSFVYLNEFSCDFHYCDKILRFAITIAMQ